MSLKVRPHICRLTFRRTIICIEATRALDEICASSPKAISNAAAAAGRLRDDEGDCLRSPGKHGAKPPLGTQALAIRQQEDLIALRHVDGRRDPHLQMLHPVLLVQRDAAQPVAGDSSDRHVDHEPGLLLDASVLLQMSEREAWQVFVAVHHSCAAGEEGRG